MILLSLFGHLYSKRVCVFYIAYYYVFIVKRYELCCTAGDMRLSICSIINVYLATASKICILCHFQRSDRV